MMQDIVQTNSNYALKSGLRRTNAFQHKYKYGASSYENYQEHFYLTKWHYGFEKTEDFWIIY